MLGLGFGEILIIGLIALLVVGPEQLPDLAKSVAKFLNEMKRTASDLKSALDQEKDIFKDDIDQFQKLSHDIKNFPDDDLSLNKNSIHPSNESQLNDLASSEGHDYGAHHEDLHKEEQLDLLPQDQRDDLESDQSTTDIKTKE